jgi:hypothetical protein
LREGVLVPDIYDPTLNPLYRGVLAHYGAVEQHAVPGLLYLLGYLVVVPLVVYFPNHLLLQWWAQRGGFVLAGGRRK